MGIHSDQTTQVKKGRIVKRITNNYDSTVSSGGTFSNHEYAPPPGKLWKLKGLYLEAPAPGGSSGTHAFIVNGGAKPTLSQGGKATTIQNSSSSIVSGQVLMW